MSVSTVCSTGSVALVVDGLEALWLFEGLDLMLGHQELDDVEDAASRVAALRVLLAPVAGVGGSLEVPVREVGLLACAADAYCYWVVSDESDRDSGFVVSDDPAVLVVADLEARIRALIPT